MSGPGWTFRPPLRPWPQRRTPAVLLAPSAFGATITGTSSLAVAFDLVLTLAGTSTVTAAFTHLVGPTLVGDPGGVLAATLAGNRGPVVLQAVFEQRDLHYTFSADLTTAVMHCAITLDNEQAVARTATFRLDATALPRAFDATTPNTFGIAVTVQVLVAGAWQSFPFGIFYCDTPQKSYSPGGGVIWDVKASDFTMLLANRTTQTPYTIPSGTTYLAAVQAILDAFALAYDLSAIGASTLPVDVTWSAGTPWIEVVDDLLFGLNYQPIWADGTGVLRTTPRLDPSTEIAAAVYSTIGEPRMLHHETPLVETIDTSTQPNVVAVAIDDPLRTASTTTHTNADPTCVLSTVVTGKQTLKQIAGSSKPSTKCVLDGATAGAIAAQELREAAARAQGATLATLFDPRRTNREFYTLQVDAVEGSTLWRVAGWSAELNPTQPGSVMTHRLGRAAAVAVS